jgi:hypothetical protein
MIHVLRVDEQLEGTADLMRRSLVEDDVVDRDVERVFAWK